jgi:outer membrane autotransporter protein
MLLTNTANAAIGTYSATIPMFYADMQTLVERMDELRLGFQATAPIGAGPDDKNTIAPPPSDETRNGIWARGFGAGQEIDNGASRVFDQNIGGFQLGIDQRFELQGGDLYLGGFGGFLYASRDFRDGGHGSTNGFSVGAYATWLGPSGWYADAVAKYSHYWNEFHTHTLFGTPSSDSYNIPALGGSLEVGKRFNLSSNKFFIEPEAQIAGLWADGMQYQSSIGLRVHGDDQTSFLGRLGLRAGMHFEVAGHHAIEPYLRASIIQEFLTGNTVSTDGDPFTPTLSGTTGRFGAGVTGAVCKSLYLYGEYDYAISDAIEEPWALNLGLRWEW